MADSILNQVFWVKDVQNREWGYFKVIGETKNGLGRVQIHGYLKPSSAFQEVRHIFLKHEIHMSKPGGALDSTWQQISALQPHLVSDESGQEMDIGGIIFIGENFLVTCDKPL